MKKTILTLALIVCFAIAGVAQTTHTGAMLDGVQPFTTTQTFNAEHINAVLADSGIAANSYNVCATNLGLVPTKGETVTWTTSHPNTSGSTLSLCSGTANSIVKFGGSGLSSGDILTTQVMVTIFDGVEWQLVNPASGSVTFKTGGNPNTTQGQLDIEGQANVGNLGGFFCANPTTFVTECNVGGIIDLTSLKDNAPGGGLLIADVGVDGGTANTYVACGGGAPTNPQKSGMEFQFIAAHTNTGASTLAWCSQTAKSIVKAGGSAIVAGDIVANQLVSLEYTGTAWQLLNPASTASGTVANQGLGAPTVGAGASTLTLEPATYVAQAFTSGADLCAKVHLALQQCVSGSVTSCKIIIDPTTPGSADVCSSANSNFFSGITNTLVELDLRALLQLKAPLIAPQTAHLVHGIGSSQNQRGSGFIMDPSFADAGNNCVFSGTGQGPFPAGTYLCLVIDGGGNWSNNAFGGKWKDLSIDCNGVANCIPFYTGNEQEDSGLEHVRIWGLAANSATSVSACGFWDHSVASGSNSGPSHFKIINSYCDPWGNGSTGTTSNNTIYGWVYEGNGSGGDILIQGSTVRANGTTQLMQDGVWIDGSNQAHVADIHCEWMNVDCVAFGVVNATTAAMANNISDANHAANAVHFYHGTGVAYNLQSGSTEVQDDTNSCSTSGSELEFYTTFDGGQGWWNNSFHVCGSGNTDHTGTIAFSAATSGTYTFAGSYTTAPQCRATFAASPGTTGLWVTTTTTILTIHTTASYTGNINYSCDGRGN